MTKHANQKTSVSALMGSAVVDAQGSTVGHVREFAVAPSIDAAHIHGIVLKLSSAKRGDRNSLVPVAHLQLTSSGALQLRETARPTPLPNDDSYLLLERDLLDQQIIDVSGHKVVRVNDVDLVWENCSAGRSGPVAAHCGSGSGHARSSPPPPERVARNLGRSNLLQVRP